jgi:hypothetical protein
MCVASVREQDLEDFINSVASHSVSDETEVNGPNGGRRINPTVNGRPIMLSEIERRRAHAARFYAAQQTGSLNDLDRGLQQMGLSQYADGLRRNGISNSTQLSTMFLDMDERDLKSRGELFSALGVTLQMIKSHWATGLG